MNAPLSQPPSLRSAPVVRLVPSPPRLRCSDAERDDIVARLQVHYADGRLRLEEYEQRAERALAAVYVDELPGLLAELPPVPQHRLPRSSRHRYFCRGRVYAVTAVTAVVAVVFAAVLALPDPGPAKLLLVSLLAIPTLAAYGFAVGLPCRHRGGTGR